MDRNDFRILCAALGFTAVMMQGGTISRKDGMKRASDFAGMIEEFCRLSFPDVFEKMDEHICADVLCSGGKFDTAERMAKVIAGIMKIKGECEPQDLLGQGFTKDAINKNWVMAKALAHVEMNMMDA